MLFLLPGEKVRMRASVNSKTSTSGAGVEQLCPNCGLCCDSTLFADVELRAGDDAKQLAKLGLTITNKTRTKLAFAQPCACFDGKLCGIYADRPKRCRTFECGLLKRVQAGELDVNAALKTIAKTKLQAEAVRGLLRQMGQNAERLAMTKRYAQAMCAPIDLSDHETDSERRGELMLAVDELMRQLQQEFLK
jgi:Fe-S-cluster containining protein